jgi:hypothetical protein
MVSVLQKMVDGAYQYANIQKVRWLLNYWWLQGLRDFYPDWRTGTVRVHLHNRRDSAGKLKMVWEDASVKLQGELGRLGRMDVRPAVAKRGWGLDAIRKRAAADVLLDYLTSPVDFKVLKASVFNHLATYGTVGISFWARSQKVAGVGPVEPQEGGEPRVMMEVIPAWQLLPIPFHPDSPEALEGIVRQRWVPLDWAKGREGLKLASDEKLDVHMAPFGARPTMDGPTGMGPLSQKAPGMVEKESFWKKRQSKETDTKYVLMEEFFFFHDEKDRLARWVVKIGKHIALDLQYKEKDVYVPIGVAKYFPWGGFYGRSFVEIILPVISEVETMASNLFQNVKDLDDFGFLTLPKNMGIAKTDLKKGKSPRVIWYEPDLVSKAEPGILNPVTTTDFPGKVMAMGNEMVDRLTQSSELMRGDAPGRVDSAVGLGFLHEMSSVPLSVPAGSVAQAFTQVYKAILAVAPDLMQGRSDLPLIGLSDHVMGLKVQPGSKTVKLEPRNYPAPHEVQLGVKDELPMSPSLRKKELLESLQSGLIDPLSFAIYCWEENIEYPVGRWADHENYRKAMMNNIMLFGDGVEPGQVVGSSEADNPRIHLMIIQRFMAKPEFVFASPAVRDAFEQLKGAYQALIRQEYPQMAYPEESAEMMQQMAGQMAGAGPPAMGGGPPAGPPM